MTTVYNMIQLFYNLSIARCNQCFWFHSSWPVNRHHWPGAESSPETQVEASVVHDMLHSVDESILHTLHSFKYVLDSDTLDKSSVAVVDLMLQSVFALAVSPRLLMV